MVNKSMVKPMTNDIGAIDGRIKRDTKENRLG